MTRRRYRPRTPVLSSTQARDETDLQDSTDAITVAVRSSPTPVDTGTQFSASPDSTAATGGTETVGRSGWDLAWVLLFNRKYDYLLLFLVIGLVGLATGHLNSHNERMSAAGLIVIGWILLFVSRWRK
jgi:hypothetical protein